MKFHEWFEQEESTTYYEFDKEALYDFIYLYEQYGVVQALNILARRIPVPKPIKSQSFINKLLTACKLKCKSITL